MERASLVSRAISAAKKPTDAAVISYRGLQRFVGAIGFLLPMVLVGGKWLFDGPGIQSSISDYYYTSMRDYFVGSLCAIGVFLSSYRGAQHFHHWVGILACGCAIGVALCPTTPAVDPTHVQQILGKLHFLFAGALFGLLAVFSLVVFPKDNARLKRLHQICGWIILGCVGIGVLIAIFASDWRKNHDPVFWLETVAIYAFAISWLVKAGIRFLSASSEPVKRAAPSPA